MARLGQAHDLPQTEQNALQANAGLSMVTGVFANLATEGPVDERRVAQDHR